MKHRKSVLSAAIVTCLGFAVQVQAQEAAAPAATPAAPAAEQATATELDTVTVVGIRGSMERSLDTKREANARVEVVTAEDIGKLPARNVADTLQRLPGVNISSSSANEGGFDENDRVSLRGTSPSLTQTLVNGHTIASADWFILSQVETVGRSVSYSLLPSELVSQVMVNKSSRAYLPEGGTMGSVNIITRKPLDFPDQLTADMSIGTVYSDLPDTTKPQFSGLLSWKNDANNFGVMVQAFKQIRELRRDGQEIVGGFSQIAATDADGNPTPVSITNPDLVGVYYPSLPGAVYFTQTRERTGGLVELQFKPNDDLTLGLSGFQSKMDAKNYNRNYMLNTGAFVPNQAPLPGYVVENNTLVKADYEGVPGTGYGVYDMISRPESKSEAGYATFDVDWRSDNLDIKGQLGTTKGTGKTPTQNIAEVVTGRGQGGGWQVNGTGSPTDWYINGTSAPTIDGFGTWGIQYYDVVDKEEWGNVDAHLPFTDGALASLDFGVRYADHTREVNSPFGSDPGNIAAALDGAPVGWYPGDFGNGLGGSFPTDIWYYTQQALQDAVNNNSTVRKDGARHNYGSEFHIEEKNTAGYVQANFDGDRWDGNVGLRYVSIDQDVQYYQQLGPDATITPDVSSLFGNFLVINDSNSHSKLLPSANFKYDITDDLLIRLAASQTMTLADYSSLAGAVSLANLTHTGTAGNSDLKPTIGTNFDANLEWYFMPRGLLSFGVFSTDLKDYVRYDSADGEYLNDQTGQYEIYNVVKPVNADGRVRGVEVAYEQPIGEFFGVNANYTYADGEYDDGGDLVGTSENTWNASAFFENDRFNARVSYTFRSSFYHGMLRANQYYQDDTENLAASVGYKFNDHLSVSLDGLNLNNGTLKYYVASGRPQAFYNNGRQYYLTLRASF